MSLHWSAVAGDDKIVAAVVVDGDVDAAVDAAVVADGAADGVADDVEKNDDS